MELNRNFSPLVFAALYRVLERKPEYHASLEDRLSGLNLDLGFLEEASEAYLDRFDLYGIGEGPSTIDSPHLVSEQHTELAAWIIAGLSTHGPCGDLQIPWRGEIAQLREEKGIDLSLQLPELSPIIKAWCLARPQLSQREDTALAFAMPLDDRNIEAAYCGLVEHLVFLETLGANRSEITSTALIWRLSGLLEALVGENRQNERGNPFEKAARVFFSQYRQLLVPKPNLKGWKDWKSVGNYRNTLTHVNACDGLTFEDATALHFQDEWWNNLQDLAMKSANFVGAFIAEKLALNDEPSWLDWGRLKESMEYGY